MPGYIFIILLLIHFGLALRFLLWRSSRFYKRKEYFVPILFVPLFGPLMAVSIEILFRIEKPGEKPLDLESLKVENETDILWTSFPTARGDNNAIPLEEAILMNDIHTRRQAVLNTFRDDPFRYLDVLMVARNDEDVDTTHYATIQISKVQRNFQLNLQKLSADYEKDPRNLELLTEYIELLDIYLHSPLPEKGILRHQRNVYIQLLNQKLSLVTDDEDVKGLLFKKLRILTDIGEDYPAALEVISLLKQRWPEDEQVWIETLRAIVNWQDSDRVQETIETMQTQAIHWTRWGREQVSPWVQV